MTERIVAAAIKKFGITFSLPAPARHHTILHRAHERAPAIQLHDASQGFLTSKGRYVEREEAKRLAKAAGQLPNDVRPYDQELYSEDLW